MTALRSDFPRIALIGFGEAAGTFLAGWALDAPQAVRAFDVKTRTAGLREAMLRRYRDAGIAGCETPAEALADAGVVFSLVTADQARAAAEAAAAAVAPGALWLDCNSCSPATKRAAAAAIEAGGGRYVDVAVMAPVAKARHRTPLLVSGVHADAAAALLRELGMRPARAGDAVGDASSIKMIRSIMIKGLEALTAECLLAARRAGVEAAVLGSLRESDPDIDWAARGSYNFERMMVHGARRAAEMREVAATIAELGLPNRMTGAAAEWQAEIAGLGLDGGPDDAADRADRILARLAPS